MDHSPDTSEGDVNQSPARRAWQERHLGDSTKSLLARDAASFLHQSLSTPCLNALRHCDGIYLEDADGRRVMDFHGNSVHQVGYGNPRVIAAIKKQLDELSFCPRRYTNEPAVMLAEKLAALAPDPLGKVLLAPSGAVAIGIAMKIARLATGRHKTLSMWGSFHGASLDAASIGGEALFRSGLGPLLPGAEHVFAGMPHHCAYGCGGSCDLRCAAHIDRVLETEGDIGAVIAEPVRCTVVTKSPEGYWQRVRQACDRHGALLVFDEIPTCLGRAGAMFVCQRIGVTPDILVIGKGLGGGIMPMAAVIARRDLDIAGDRAIGHYTHEKSPVGCAAALATIACIEEEGLLTRANDLGAHAVERLAWLRRTHPIIGDVRGLGLMLAVDIVRDATSRAPAPDKAEAVMYEALVRGLSFKVSDGNVLTLTPPLTITAEQIDAAVQILAESVAAVELEFGSP